MAEADLDPSNEKPFWLPGLTLLGTRLRSRVRSAGKSCWSRLCGLARQYRTVWPAQWRLVPKVLNRVLLALRVPQPAFTPVGSGVVWYRWQAPALAPELATAVQANPGLGELHLSLERVREQSFRRVVEVIENFDRELARSGDVGVTAVLRADAAVGADVLAALGGEAGLVSKAQLTTNAPLVWQRLPMVELGRLCSNNRGTASDQPDPACP